MSTRRCTMILAAGQGTRMKSPLPKVLHLAAGVPLIAWAIEAARDAGADDIRAELGKERGGRTKALDIAQQVLAEAGS